MPQSSTIVVLPLLLAILCLASYLMLRVVDAMSFTLTIVYAAVAIGFLIWAIVCTRI